jgi:Asp-tRNA(Asn)/Glu-tRNA(Gln) amidotransferase A subunit family amidase
MLQATSPLTQLRQAYADGTATPLAVAQSCAQHANASASHNTYLHFSPDALAAQAADLTAAHPNPRFRPPLFGVPISLKDCFDLAGTITTAGSRFYAEHNPIATADSAIGHQLRAAGCLIPGKTHLHALAYGITGQNPEYGDCVQPRDATLLTGGSSSGAAASVQEGSALAAIGTDTGGSIRVPAALCGITGYRASHSLAYGNGPWPASPGGIWRGGIHLASTFDTIGFFTQDPRDLAPIAKALFGVPHFALPNPPRIGFVHESMLTDATPEVLAGYAMWRRQLTPHAAFLESFKPAFFDNALETFAGIQAAEAATVHAGHFKEFETAIAQRLTWGASFTPAEVDGFRKKLEIFRTQMAYLFRTFDLIMLPAAPVHRLLASDDQSNVRSTILRYTTPFSLAGVPVISLPGEIIRGPFGTGIQLAAAPGKDAALLAFAAIVGQFVAPPH